MFFGNNKKKNEALRKSKRSEQEVWTSLQSHLQDFGVQIDAETIQRKIRDYQRQHAFDQVGRKPRPSGTGRIGYLLFGLIGFLIFGAILVASNEQAARLASPLVCPAGTTLDFVPTVSSRFDNRGSNAYSVLCWDGEAHQQPLASFALGIMGIMCLIFFLFIALIISAIASARHSMTEFMTSPVALAGIDIWQEIQQAQDGRRQLATEERLRLLDELYEDGLLSRHEYETKRHDILTEADEQA